MRLPMNALLSQALVTVTHEYEQRGAGSVSLPTLAVWSNVLRPSATASTYASYRPQRDCPSGRFAPLSAQR